MKREIIERAWAQIGELTPMKTDCGALCGAACCKEDDDGKGGVCLLPGEEVLIGMPEWANISFEETMGCAMIECVKMCDRARRPFLCRIFPLCPVHGKNGWTVRMDARARAICPLSVGGVRALDPQFVRGCVRAVRILAEDSEGEAFLERWAAIEAEFRRPLF